MLFASSSYGTLPVQVFTGVLCASYWRGAWYILDHTLFPNDRLLSGIVSLTSGSALLGMKQYVISPSYNGTKRLVRLLPPPKSISLRRRYVQTNRFIVLYGIASGCILIWRGTWLLWDEAAHGIAICLDSRNNAVIRGSSSSSSSSAAATSMAQSKSNAIAASATTIPIAMATTPQTNDHHHHQHHHHQGESTLTQHDDIEENTLFYSGIASHVLATLGLLAMGRYACVMAPPANVTMLRDRFIHAEGKEFARAVRKFVSHT
jgi:hypothetical protein